MSYTSAQAMRIFGCDMRQWQLDGKDLTAEFSMKLDDKDRFSTNTLYGLISSTGVTLPPNEPMPAPQFAENGFLVPEQRGSVGMILPSKQYTCNTLNITTKNPERFEAAFSQHLSNHYNIQGYSIRREMVNYMLHLLNGRGRKNEFLLDESYLRFVKVADGKFYMIIENTYTNLHRQKIPGKTISVFEFTQKDTQSATVQIVSGYATSTVLKKVIDAIINNRLLDQETAFLTQVSKAESPFTEAMHALEEKILEKRIVLQNVKNIKSEIASIKNSIIANLLNYSSNPGIQINGRQRLEALTIMVNETIKIISDQPTVADIYSYLKLAKDQLNQTETETETFWGGSFESKTIKEVAKQMIELGYQAAMHLLNSADPTVYAQIIASEGTLDKKSTDYHVRLIELTQKAALVVLQASRNTKIQSIRTDFNSLTPESIKNRIASAEQDISLVSRRIKDLSAQDSGQVITENYQAALDLFKLKLDYAMANNLGQNPAFIIHQKIYESIVKIPVDQKQMLALTEIISMTLAENDHKDINFCNRYYHLAQQFSFKSTVDTGAGLIDRDMIALLTPEQQARRDLNNVMMTELLRMSYRLVKNSEPLNTHGINIADEIQAIAQAKGSADTLARLALITVMLINNPTEDNMQRYEKFYESLTSQDFEHKDSLLKEMRKIDRNTIRRIVGDNVTVSIQKKASPQPARTPVAVSSSTSTSWKNLFCCCWPKASEARTDAELVELARKAGASIAPTASNH